MTTTSSSTRIRRARTRTSSARCRRFPARRLDEGEGNRAGVPRAAAGRQDRCAQRLELNLGGRSSDYETAGRVETYKADGLWEPFKGFTFRGGFEHAIRAPNIGELYNQVGAQAQIGSPPGQGDPCDVRSTARTGANGAAVRDLCVATGVPGAIVDTYQYTTVAIGVINSGNTDLTPEEADTHDFRLRVQARS